MRTVNTAAAMLVLTAVAAAEGPLNHPGLMYIGTLDKKLLVFDEDKEEVVGENPAPFAVELKVMVSPHPTKVVR